MTTLQAAIDEGKRLGKTALYFGCWSEAGHYLHDVQGHHLYRSDRVADLPWDEGLMDATLLRNGKVLDVPDGRVYWTCGGSKAFWYAFYWWDRSIDTRGACNSGFYVRGFGWPESQAAFDYACSQFPHIVDRQHHPLVLQDHVTRQSFMDMVRAEVATSLGLANELLTGEATGINYSSERARLLELRHFWRPLFGHPVEPGQRA
jgi:hypothetical protein